MRLRSIELLEFRNNSNNIVKLINKNNSNLHHLSTCIITADQWNSQRNSTKISLGINNYADQLTHNQINNSDLDTFTPFQPHLTMNWISNNLKYLEMKEINIDWLDEMNEIHSKIVI